MRAPWCGVAGHEKPNSHVSMSIPIMEDRRGSVGTVVAFKFMTQVVRDINEAGIVGCSCIESHDRVYGEQEAKKKLFVELASSRGGDDLLESCCEEVCYGLCGEDMQTREQRIDEADFFVRDDR